MNLLLTIVLSFSYQRENSDSLSTKESRRDSSPGSRRRSSIKAEAANETTRTNVAFRGNDFIKPEPEWKQTCNVQYSLPSKEDKKKDIKITFLGSCAEINFKNVSTTVKSKVLDDQAFVAFTMLHHIESKEMTAPVHIRESNIQVNFTLGSDSTKSKADSKTFYYFCEDIQTDFGYLVEAKHGEVPAKLERFSLKASKNDYLLVRPCKFHWKNIQTLINKAVAEINDLRNTQEKLYTPCGEHKTEMFTDESVKTRKLDIKGSRSTAKSHLSQKMKTPEIILSVTGNHLIYEKSAWTFNGFNSDLNKKLLYSGLILTNTGVYTNQQRKYFKSLAIFIKSIQNLPRSVTEKYNVNKIYLEYNFQPICKNQTVGPVALGDASKLKIKDVRTFFNQNIPETKLVEAVQNNMLVVKVMGIREKGEEDVVPKVWGQELRCTDFSKRFNNFINNIEPEKESPDEVTVKSSKKQGSQKSKASSNISVKSQKGSSWLQEPNTESVVLGYTSVSLYELMKYYFKMTASVPIHSSYLPTSNQFHTSLRPMNVMHFHKDYRPVQKGIVDETSFNDNKTLLKIEVKLGYDLARQILPVVLSSPTLITVCIIIDYDIRSSYSLLKKILDHNCNVLHLERGWPNIIYQNFSQFPAKNAIRSKKSSIHEQKVTKETTVENQNYITGFMVDLVEFAIIMIESIEIEAIPKIMVHRYQMLIEEGRMLYNSNLVFTERLYDQFTKFGGIFVSALGLPLDSVLGHRRSREFVPTPALRCLETLKAITTAKKIQRNLFPTPLELLSMDTEFGVPLYRIER